VRRQLHRSSRCGPLIGTAILAALVWPAVASAHRPATKAETSAMIYTASGRYYVNGSAGELRSAPLRCFTADISTVVKGARWGAWTWSKFADTHLQQCQTANGITIEHKIGKQWYVLWEGSEGYPPTHKKRVGALTLMPVPRAVAKDLASGLS
jgi:hypothetical protein